jgi:hypothetical protein
MQNADANFTMGLFGGWTETSFKEHVEQVTSEAIPYVLLLGFVFLFSFADSTLTLRPATDNQETRPAFQVKEGLI